VVSRDGDRLLVALGFLQLTHERARLRKTS